MQLPNLIEIYIKPLEELKINYVITGSIASIIYGEPRLTQDIDLVLKISNNDIPKLLNAFSNEKFYKPPLDVAIIENNRSERGHVNLINLDTGFKADIYFIGKDNLSVWAINNFIKVSFFNLNLRIAPVEYVIIKKLIYYREAKMQKHIIDIAGILNNSKEQIDFDILDKFLNEYSLRLEWEEVLKIKVKISPVKFR